MSVDPATPGGFQQVFDKIAIATEATHGFLELIGTDHS